MNRDPYGLSHVIRPGRLPEPPKPIYTRDTPANMEKCLCCPYPDCISCLGRGTSGTRAARRAEFSALYDAGLTDVEIAFKMHVAPPTAAYYRKRDKLPPNLK